MIESLFIPLFLSCASIIFTLASNLFTDKKIKMVDYRNNRSEYVTQNRFDKEIDCIQDLSENLLLLIQETKYLIESPGLTTNSEWIDQRKRVIESIGRAAPFLNYLDLSNSSIPFCGVNRTQCKKPQQDDINQRENETKRKIQKSCICLEKSDSNNAHCKNACSESLAITEIQANSSDSLFIEYFLNKATPEEQKDRKSEAELVGKNLYHRACEILMLCEHSKRTGTLNCVRSGKDCSGNSSSPHEYRTYLDCRYERFIDCAYCRLNTIEYGRDSLRKKKRKEASWLGRRREEKMKKYDQLCPYEPLKESDS